jgi:hypothetical protein
MRCSIAIALAAAISLASLADAASLDKAKTLRANGLRDEAKGELVDFLFDAASPADGKAEALLLLGEIALDEKNVAAARENWNKVLADYPSTAAATTAKAKLEVLVQVAQAQSAGAPTYAPGTVLVIGPSDYDWAAPQIAGARSPAAVPTSGTLSDAIRLAGTESAIIGVLHLDLDVDSVFETGRLTCYRPNGSKVWDQTVRVSSPGGAEHVAHVFVNKLAKKTKSKTCP